MCPIERNARPRKIQECGSGIEMYPMAPGSLAHSTVRAGTGVRESAPGTFDGEPVMSTAPSNESRKVVDVRIWNFQTIPDENERGIHSGAGPRVRLDCIVSEVDALNLTTTHQPWSSPFSTICRETNLTG